MLRAFRCLPGSIAVVALLALSACSVEPRRPAGAGDWSAHLRAVGAAAHWQLQGKIGIREPGNSGSAMLSWRQQADESYLLVLAGALGLGKLVIRGDANGVEWTNSRGESLRYPDPEALIREVWGWGVPIDALRFWVRGIPQPGIPFESLITSDAMAAGFSQAGWTLSYSDYRTVDGLALPTRIRLERGEVVLTVVVSRWQNTLAEST
jgi:outer membrane lipoprotein LolB